MKKALKGIMLLLAFVAALGFAACTKKEPEKEPVVITLSKTSVSLVEGNKETITATTSDSSTVTWSTADASIATVAAGEITAVAAGSTTITATSGEVSATVAVTVTKKAPDVITPRSIVLEGMNDTDVYVAGDTLTLTASVKPDGAAQEVLWASNDEAIATVSEAGLVSFVGLGDGSITVTSATRATVSYTYEFTVNAPAPASIEITGGESVLINETLTLSAKVLPELAAQAVLWNSSDPIVATVDATGTVQGISAGKTTITATSKANPAITKGLEIEVTLPDPKNIVISGLNEVYMVGETASITANVEPALASQVVTYTSSNESVISVSATGALSALAIGKSTITVQSAIEAVKYTVEVTVIAAITPDTSKAIVIALGDAARYDEITYEGVTYYAHVTAFASLGEALDAAVANQTITVTAGTWSGEGTISVAGLKIYGVNKDIDPSKGTRKTPSIITGKITLDGGTDAADDLSGLEFNGLDFTTDARIVSTKEDFSKFVFAYNSVHDWTEKPASWTAETLTSFTGFLTLYFPANSNRAAGVTINNNLFDGVADTNVYLARVNTVTVKDNVFHNFSLDAYRVDGGYNGGLHEITGNTFKNDVQQGCNGIYYKSMSANSGDEVHTVKIEDNTFENIGTPGSTLAFNGAFSGFRYQENGAVITFRFNKVLNCVNDIRVRTNGAVASSYSLTISYNLFKGDAESYIYTNDYSGEDNPKLAVFQYNLFESADGTILSTLDAAKFKNYKTSSDLYASEADYEAGVAAAKA